MMHYQAPIDTEQHHGSVFPDLMGVQGHVLIFKSNLCHGISNKIHLRKPSTRLYLFDRIEWSHENKPKAFGNQTLVDDK